MVYNWWTQWFPYFPGMTRIVWIHLIFIRYHVCSRCRLPCCRSHGLLWENGCRIAKAAAANPRGSGAVPAYSSSRFCKCGRSHWVGVIVLGSLFQIGTGFGRFRSSIPRTSRHVFYVTCEKLLTLCVPSVALMVTKLLGVKCTNSSWFTTGRKHGFAFGRAVVALGVRFTDRMFSWVQ
jgi:hypothetical protein